MCISKTINSIGLEVECGIDEDKLEQLNNWIRQHRLHRYFYAGYDGSVHVRDREIPDAELKFWHTNTKKIQEFMDYLYNECKIKTDYSCGLHIHVKMSEDSYAKLSYITVVKQFIDKYKQTFANKAKYINRLVNSFSRENTSQEYLDEATYGHGGRYYAVNFTSLSVHNTLEFRLLPNQASFNEFKKTFAWFIDTIDKILEHPNIRTEPQEIKIRKSRIPKDATETIEIDHTWCKVKEPEQPEQPNTKPVSEQMQLFAVAFTKPKSKRTKATDATLRSG